ncbi:PTS mannose/fructose/sorbose/N-acetylgalactosamine transporter subunit IIC [Enterococcus camelliae]|uniref:PTS mannose/fructose/sorbose/N-acetylgalactosamine transporter subunit IIC n=1 Tax=Enterococcus camelliae TaxID=453959 RepID=A0ABW5TGI0_9ENTE
MVNAVLVAFIMYLSKFFDWGFGNLIPRPIWIGPLVGLVLGDLTQGIILGAAIEAVFMGTFTVGGSVPSDIQTGAIFGTAFGILTGKGVAAGVAIAVPAGLLATLLFNLVVLFFNFLVDYMDRSIANRKDWKFNNAHIFAMFFYPIPFAIMTFIGIYAGVGPIESFMNNLPSQVNAMLNVMAQTLPALGMAILTKSMWDKSIIPFFFIGFVLASYLGMNTMGIAILGGAFAVYFIFHDFKHTKEMAALKKAKALQTNTGNTSEMANEMEDFLS